MTITSPTNALVKELVRLKSRRHRDATGRFVIEGHRPLTRAIAAGVAIERQIVCPDLGGEAVATDADTVVMAESPFRKASIRENPDGVMAIALHIDTALSSLVLPDNALVLVVESIEKPGNLGAMLRTCDAVGADAVIVADATTDVHNPNVVRASQGALFTVSMAAAATDELLAWLRQQDMTLIATTPEATTPVWEEDLTGWVAIAIGAESEGLSRPMLEAADRSVLIPMRGTVDSLNASVTAAMAVYEAVRQRAGQPKTEALDTAISERNL